MAFPSVAGRQTSSVVTNNTSHIVSLPASIASGNLLIVVFSYGITANTISFPAGWTAITNGAAEETGGSSHGIATAYRQADGSEGASITVTSSVATRSAHVVLRITGHENPATQAPEAAATNGANGNADPPNLAPTGGAKDYLWIACGANSHLDIYTAAPTNYTDLTQTEADTGTAGNSAQVGTGERQLNAASENPGAFTGANAVAEWAAVTIAIHPAAASGTAVPVFVHHLKNQGIA